MLSFPGWFPLVGVLCITGEPNMNNLFRHISGKINMPCENKMENTDEETNFIYHFEEIRFHLKHKLLYF